ncbi:cytochrome P450 [Xylaria cf. heliscus]|nr:cytochrome P450 [Xylaria cf. heliscus]
MLMPLLLATLLVFVTYSYMKLRHKRFSQYAYLPQLPPSLLLGHLKIIDEYIRRGAVNRHPDVIFSEMHEALGRPPLMFIDFRPVNRPLVLVANHEIAEQVSKASSLFPTSLPKSDLKYLKHLIGLNSIIASHGDEWKTLRKRFNPGFAPQHLVTLLPCILDKTLPFITHLDHYARTQEEFSLVPLIINLTFDIIGSIVMDVDLEAQHLDSSNQGEFVQVFGELISAYNDDVADLPWWLIPRTEMKRRRLGKRINVLIKDLIRRKFGEEREKSAAKNKSRSILALSLGDTESLSPELIDVTCDQLKSFLLAGHDTTSVTLAWCFYELSLHPHALAAVRAELDSLLGTDTSPEAVRARFLSSDGPEIVHKMAYISAVVKETLRLHPPAATARMSEHGTGFTVRMPTGEDCCLDGVIIYNCEAIMHRDPTIYGDSADRFAPERWLNEGDVLAQGLSTARRVPASAWRPFERGPRSCIGQELANFEARIIIAFIARRYDFIKVGLGEIARDENDQPIMDGQGYYQLKSPLYNMRQVTSKPVDGMKVRVVRVGKAN